MNSRDVLLLLIAFCFSAVAQQDNDFNKQWEISPSVKKINLGTLLQGEVREVSINLKNTAIFGIQSINKVSKSCNCFDINISSDSIPLSGSVTLKVKVAARAGANDMYEEVIIEYINSDEKNIRFLRIPIVATVETVLSFDPKTISVRGDELALQQFVLQFKIIPGRRFSNVKFLLLNDADEIIKIEEKKLLNDKVNLNIEARINVQKLQFGRNQTYININACDALGDIILNDRVPCEIYLDGPFSIEPAAFLISDVAVGSSRQYKILININDVDFQTDDIQTISSDLNHIIIEKNNVISKASMEVIFRYFRPADGVQKDYIEIQFAGKRKGNYRIPIIALNVH